MDSIFTQIYEKEVWGTNSNPEYKGSSGDGSEIQYNTQDYIPFLRKFIQDKDIQSVIDLGCGDFRCGPSIYDDLQVSYTGYDAYKDLIDHNSRHFSPIKYSFFHLDFFSKREELKGGDLCILKDVLQHWSLHSIYTFLDFIVQSGKYRYILITNTSDQSKDNTDTPNGGYRPLNCYYLPLKKYSPDPLLHYKGKQTSCIQFNKK